MGSMLIVHRCIGILEDGTLIMKGDNNDSANPPVSPEKVMYKVFWYPGT